MKNFESLTISAIDNGYVVSGYGNSPLVNYIGNQQNVQMCFSNVEEAIRFIEKHLMTPEDRLAQRENLKSRMNLELAAKQAAMLTPVIK